MGDAAIKLYPWSKTGGRWFEIGDGFGLLWMVKWSVWAIGFEIFQTGAALFVGPFCIAIGTVQSSPNETEESALSHEHMEK